MNIRKVKYKIIYYCIISAFVPFLQILYFHSVLYAFDYDGWRIMPILSEEEFNSGIIGGEGEQHMHGIARCLNNPDIIYLSHDVGQVWRSDNSGETWTKCLCKNMHVTAGMSIEADPVNSDIVFVIVDKSYNTSAADYEGLFRSIDGGKTFELVLPTPPNYLSDKHRMYTHNIAYDSSSITETSGRAMTWYAAFPQNGIYRSDDSGDSWRLT